MKNLVPCSAQGGVCVRHRRRAAEGCEAGDAVLADAAGDDAAEMAEVRGDVEGNAVPAYPARDPHPDRGNLVFGAGTAVLLRDALHWYAASQLA